MEFDKIIENYIDWIRDNTLIKTIKEGNTASIDTPFLDRHNDTVQFYVTKKDDKFILTDDGYTVHDLSVSGLDLNSERRQKIFQTTLNGFGIKYDKGSEALFVETNSNNIGQKKHYFIQAILAINDMYSLSKESVFSLFNEDIERFFKENEIIYVKDVRLAGRSGFDHKLDFTIPASKTRPERLIRTVNEPKKDLIGGALWSFQDIRLNRDNDTLNYVIYNDMEKSASVDVLDALRNYGVRGIGWKDKDKIISELSLN